MTAPTFLFLFSKFCAFYFLIIYYYYYLFEYYISLIIYALIKYYLQTCYLNKHDLFHAYLFLDCIPIVSYFSRPTKLLIYNYARFVSHIFFSTLCYVSILLCFRCTNFFLPSIYDFFQEYNFTFSFQLYISIKLRHTYKLWCYKYI